MLRTVGIFAVIIVAIVVFMTPRGRHTPNVVRVDYTAELHLVQHRAPFHVYAPRGLPATWTPTHVSGSVPQQGSTTTSFDVGFYIAPADAYVHLQQANDPALLSTTLGAKRAANGTRVIGGQHWQSWSDSAGRPALVRTTSDGSTIVLSGKAGNEVLSRQLSILAADLH